MIRGLAEGKGTIFFENRVPGEGEVGVRSECFLEYALKLCSECRGRAYTSAVIDMHIDI